MYRRSSVIRLIQVAAVLAWGVALVAQPRAGVPAFRSDRNTTEPAESTNLSITGSVVPLQLAGLPSADAAPGKRIFLTVTDDVYQNGALYIAAGARAKGFIRNIHRDGDTLRLSLDLQSVQTAAGPQAALNNRPVELEINTADAQAPHFPFSVALAPAAPQGDAAPVLYR